MTLAIWDYPPAEFLVSGITSGKLPDAFEVVRCPVAGCLERLLAGEVDVAMVSTLQALQQAEAVDVLPAVALSTWSYPFARLVLRRGLERKAKRIAYDPAYALEQAVSRLILREHYRMEPTFVPRPGASQEVLLAGEEDGCLIVGPEVPTLETEGLALDLGQEWYELANYPMVWAFFAMRKGEVTPAMIRALRGLGRAAERQRQVWVRARETTARLHTFYADDLRLRLDDLAVASLTELRHYLFYFNLIEDVTEVPVVFLEEDEDDDTAGGGRLPQV